MKLFSKRYAAVLAASLFLFPLVFGTSPKVLFHRYEVPVSVTSAAGRPLSDFTVVLLGKRATDASFVRLPLPFGSTLPVAGITDSLGSAFLLVTTYSPMDTLCVAVISPDHPAVYGTAFAVTEVMGNPQYAPKSSTGGCNSCSQEVVVPVDVEGYFFPYLQKTVTVPW